MPLLREQLFCPYEPGCAKCALWDRNSDDCFHGLLSFEPLPLKVPIFLSPGSSALLSAEQNHKVDTSVHYNIPELQSSSRVPLPQHNGQQEPPTGRKGPPMQEADQDSEEDSEDDSEEDSEEAPRRQWQGIEAIFEAYQEHIEGRGLCESVIKSDWSTLDFCQSRAA